MTKKAFLFDMDGLIFKRTNFWRDVHETYGNTDTVMAEFFPAVEDVGYISAFKDFYVPKFWTDVKTDPFMNLVEEREYSAGIFDFVEAIKSKDYYTVIISSGPYQLAERAQKDLGIDVIFANRVNIGANNKFDGTSFVQVDDLDKSIISTKFHTAYKDIVAMGDGNADAKLVSDDNHTLIAYNPSDSASELVARADRIISTNSFKRAYSLI